MKNTLPIKTLAVGMASNFGHRSRSRRSKILGYDRRPSAFSPILKKSNRESQSTRHCLALVQKLSCLHFELLEGRTPAFKYLSQLIFLNAGKN